MSLVINTNSIATTATRNLATNSANLARSLARLSSGSKIVIPSDDAGGLAVASKIKAALNRNVRTQQNVQNALSYMQVQDGALKVASGILDRMSELKTMSLDVTKNSMDIVNYDAEFTQLQSQLTNIKNEDFNGIGLFNATANLTTYTTSDGDSSTEPSVTTTRTGLFQELGNVTYGGGYGDVAVTEYNSAADYTLPTGAGAEAGTVAFKTTATDGSIRLAVLTSVADTVSPATAGNGLTFDEAVATGGLTAGNADANDLADMTEISNVDSIYDYETGTLKARIFQGIDGNETAGSVHAQGEIVFDDATNAFYIAAGTGANYSAVTTAAAAIDTTPGEFIKLDGFPTIAGNDAYSSSEAYELGDIVSHNDSLWVANKSISVGSGTAGTGNTADWAQVSSSATSGADLLTSSNALSAYTTADFQTFIQTAATARAQNGAEMQRLNVSAEMLDTNHTNFEAAHSRLADVDIARESTQFAKNNILVQSATAMLSQANNLPSIALQLLQ